MRRACPRSVLLTLLLSAGAQGASFQNLNFEAANIITLPGGKFGDVLTEEAFPGWSVDWVPMGEGDNPDYGESAMWVLYNSTFLSGGSALIMGPHRDDIPEFGSQDLGTVIEGSYSAALFGARFRQRGMIPAGVRSIEFDLRGQGISVFANGIPLTPVPIGVTGPSGGRFGVDVSQWAGMETELMFSQSIDSGLSVLDRITLIPEPAGFTSAVGLSILGAGVWLRRRKAPFAVGR